ncbi:acyl carrier protein [Amycolatopsis sp. YIM 10]|uniref:acyl carrier protein n=1 Tax=Amycolatopsis sp. YIM 10 TaxID=2653857 RepID=UPI0012A79F60|nr:acyl carrier protein [Amycolatopsis sp. YIM 10]QFU90540.1 Meromycolate extension acyl carrier protein [Amycolatopsis sp. YIM 10]
MTEQMTALDKEELRMTIADILDVDVAEVADETHFVEELEVDSLMALEISVRLEKKYLVKLAESEVAELTTLNKTFGLLQAKRAAA